jgi:hypothetical protein
VAIPYWQEMGSAGSGIASDEARRSPSQEMVAEAEAALAEVAARIRNENT